MARRRGPAPAAQARASRSRLTRSSWRTWPHRKLRRNVPRVEGALTMHPSTEEVRPARSASASSMQSPPASAEATSVSSLSPAFARPGASPEVEVTVNEFTQAHVLGQGGRKEQPALLTRRWSSKAIWMRSGCSSGSICWVFLVSGRFPLSKTIIPDAKEHFLTPSPRRDAHLFGGLGLSEGDRSHDGRSAGLRG